MQGDTGREPEPGRILSDDANPEIQAMQLYLFALPGAVDIVVCPDADSLDTTAAQAG